MERFSAAGLAACRISEITVAELLYGAANSGDPARNLDVSKMFLRDMEVITISACLPVFANEKARLRKLGQPLPDFDLLIGATAVHHGLTLVTNNTKHFQRIQGIQLEDWTI
ncbi:MAG: PIN domain-containing protein [Flavobacteriales bacterium]|nr:PIN domain-containing protein [Flavobacteriales bacterium]